MRNRLVLLGLTLAAWMGLKLVDALVPWPAILFILCLIILVMITHSSWFLVAQRKRNRAEAKRLASGEVIPVVDWQPLIDIFISAKNEARVIEGTVRGFMKLNYTNFNLWVIDDQSDDDMPVILKRLQDEFPRLKVLTRLSGSKPGKSAALNEALPLAKGEVIAVFDADASVAPDFFQTMLPLLAADDCGAVQSQKRIYEHQNGFLVQCQSSEYALDTYFQSCRDLIGGAVELRGNGQLLKRSALIDVGGWNNDAITDDLDLTMRLLLAKWDVRFCAEAVVWEEAVTTLKALLRQRRRWAEGSIRRYIDYIFPMQSPRRLSFVERLDILAFISEFAVPGLMLLEIVSEAINYVASGGQTAAIHPRFLVVVALAVWSISAFNFYLAVRKYRKLSIPLSFMHAVVVNTYVYAHWVPVVIASFLHIMTGRGASKWHRTEHAGQGAN